MVNIISEEDGTMLRNVPPVSWMAVKRGIPEFWKHAKSGLTKLHIKKVNIDVV